MRWVIDASVAAKWLVPEEGSDLAVALLEAELLAPDLLFAEVANILWKKQARSEMDAATALAAGRWLAQVPFAVHDCATLMPAALELSLRLRHPAYDCFYLALAIREGCSLITADRKLAATCQDDPLAALSGSVLHLSELPAGR